MPITFNSDGGFLNGTISSSNGDIFITTSGSVGSINIGNQQLSGSQILEKDAAGKVRNKKTFNSDGTITQEKFDQNGLITETKYKDPATGKEFARSGSSLANQIEFEQSSTGAYITVSGSDPGFNIIEVGGTTDFNVMRAQYELRTRDSQAFIAGINSNKNYQISPGVAFQSGIEMSPSSHITASGNISSSGTITGNELKGGTTQNTGSYDFPGAIMGYNVQGLNATHASYTLTTSFAVPDEGMHVVFVAPKSGIVEIEVQIYLDMGSSAGTFIYFGLSDAASYSAVQSYYEQVIANPDENDDLAITHKWVVSGLTAGNTYKYWLGAKTLSTTGTPKLSWGGSSSQRFTDFIMKATALPSNTEIES